MGRVVSGKPSAEDTPLDTSLRPRRLDDFTGQAGIKGNLSMGADMSLSGVLDSLDKRFLTLTEATVFPMFPARTNLPKNMPLTLLNRAKISHYHLIPCD